MNIHALRMAMIAIAQTVEAAGAPILGHRLRALPDPDTSDAKALWLEQMRGVAALSIDRCETTGKLMGGLRGHALAVISDELDAWTKVARALDEWGKYIYEQLTVEQEARAA